jgi:hypothetical protein
MEVDSFVFSVMVGIFFGKRFLRERSEVGFVMSFVGLESFGEFEVLFKHFFVLIMVIAITVDDAIDELMAK